MGADLRDRSVAFVVPHSPSAVGYDDVGEFLRYAEYHRRFCHCAFDRGASVEFVLLSQDASGGTPDSDFPIRLLPVTAGTAFGREMSTELVRYLWTTDADVIHLHGYNQPNVLHLVPPLARFDGRTVAHNHGAALDTTPLKHRLWYRLFVRTVAPALDCVLSVNRKELEHLVEFGLPTEKAGHLPNAVDADLFSPGDRDASRVRLGLDDDRRYLLFVGRITEHKGVPYLVEALADLPSDVTLLLVYAGVDGETMTEVEGTVREEGLEDRVRFVGAVDRPDLPDYYNAADVCVFPSVTEGFGIVSLEAMACRRPVVGTTEHAAAGHLVHGETGMVAEPRSVESLVENVEALLSDAALAARIAETGRERVLDRYTWDAVCATLASIHAGGGGGCG